MSRRFLSRAGLALFALLVAVQIGRAVAAADWRAVPAVIAAWYVTDLLSGAIHMAFDYRPCRRGVGLADLFFYEGSRESVDYLALKAAVMRRIGPLERLVFDFKTHHPRPEALARRGLERQVTSTILAGGLPGAILLTLADRWLVVPGWVDAGGAVLLLGSGFAQYFHGALHRDDNPWPISAMRRLGLLMTPQAHGFHHASLRCDFATVNGWSNPLLNHAFVALRRGGWLSDGGLEPSRDAPRAG